MIYRIWSTDFSIQLPWMVNFSHALLTLIVLFVVFRWDIIGYQLRYWLYGACLSAMGASFFKVQNRSFYRAEKMQWRWGQLLEIIIFAAALVWAFIGFNPNTAAVDLEQPLKGNSYYVVQGGTTPILNYHGAFAESQTYAVDVSQLNSWGFRAEGAYPGDPGQYAVFGDTVYSPIAGKIIQASDSLADQSPPKTLPAKPVGNHIWIRSDSLYIVLAHLKHESIQVSEDDSVLSGQPLAQVGNTGNTSEPHLHLHAVTYPNKKPGKDSLLLGGKPIPVTFNDRFLIRNSIF